MISGPKVEEIFSYGKCNGQGQIGFKGLIQAFRSFFENEIHEWFQIAIGDDSLNLTLDEFQAVLAESKHFPISEDLNEVFKELETYLKSISKVADDKSDLMPPHPSLNTNIQVETLGNPSLGSINNDYSNYMNNATQIF